MKKLIPLLGILLACVACEKNLDTYNGGNGIYFDTKDMYLDTLEVQWGLKNTEIKEQEIDLKVCLFGNTTDYDRKFTIELQSESNEFGAQEGVDYEAMAKEYTIPANASETTIKVKLKRRSDLDVQPKRFTIKLVENNDLHFLFSREENLRSPEGDAIGVRPLDYQRVIYMDESFPMPGWWYVYGNSIFGKWSARKSAIICDVMNIDRELFIKSDGTGLERGYLKYCGKKVHRWLQDNPQTEEDGTPMEMGPNSQV